MSEFTIDPRLSSEAETICELDLCRLLLSRNALCPWVILVPKRDNLREIIDLSETDRMILMREISAVSQVMQDIFKPDKLNVASLGNIVPQLHVHIIARYEQDSAWPLSPFGAGKSEYTEEKFVALMEKIKGIVRKIS